MKVLEYQYKQIPNFYAIRLRNLILSGINLENIYYENIKYTI